MPRQRQDHDDDPARRLIGPAEFARLLGHKDTSTVSHWVADQPRHPAPPDFPAPDEWEELPTRRRPKWQLSRAQAFATANPPVTVRRTSNPHGRSGRPSETAARAADVARELAAAGSPAPTREDIEQRYGVPAHTARRILARAREIHEDSQ